MSLDLNSKDGRKKFISENMSDLSSAINDTYGPVILDELLKRIESTVSQFNEEVTEAFVKLKNIDKKRQNLYKQIDPTDDK